MAPTLQGEHGRLTCHACRFPYHFDLESARGLSRIVCPNCGHVHDASEAAIEPQPADRVTLDRWPLLRQGPSRMELVSFPHPEQPGELAVKRVIGLPGEKLAIRRGNLYIDEQLWRKNRHEFRALGVLVHDDAYRDPEGSPWRPLDRDASANSGFRWIGFEPPAVLNVPEAIASHTITDNDPYNPGANRELHDVLEIRVTGTVKDCAGRIAWQLYDGPIVWQVEYDAATGDIVLQQVRETSRDWERVATEQDVPRTGFTFELATIDDCVWLLLDDQVVLRHPYERPSPPADEAQASDAAGTQRIVHRSLPLAIAREQPSTRLDDLRVYRDIYWLDPTGLGTPWSLGRALAADEYFLLGDNVPVSTDSRHFGPVRRAELRGVVRTIASESRP